MSLRVLVVDDHQRFREVAVGLLSTAGFDVVGQASDGASAMRAADRLRPDVVLLDVRLPDKDGISVSHELHEVCPPPAVVLVSGRDQSEFGDRLASSPARGFIPKDELSIERLRDVLACPH